MFPSDDESGMNNFAKSNPSPFYLFLKLAVGLAIVIGVYNLAFSGGQTEEAQAQNVSAAQTQGQDANQDALGLLSGIFDSSADSDQPPQEVQADPAFYRPVIVDDGIEGSFFKLSYQSLIAENGETVGQINDILVNPVSGDAAVIIYSLSGEEDMANPVLYRVGYEDVAVRETGGDFRVNVEESRLLNRPQFEYNPQVLGQFISLKYLRQAELIDSYGEVVGEMREVTFRNNRADQVIFRLDSSLAPTQPRRFSMPFGNAHIVWERDGYNLQLTEQQTAALAAQLYVGQAPQTVRVAPE